MSNEYRKNYGILVGIFNEEELKRGEDDKAIELKQQEYPKCKYINAIETKKDGKRALKVYICELKDLKMNLF